MSLASVAQKYNLKRPYVTEENVINIVGGRHPLQELVVPAFIENDTMIVGGDDAEMNSLKAPSVLLLTGANYSGKSVYLKQVFIQGSVVEIGLPYRLYGAPRKVVS
jgi:DNA mismatch repair protein MSH5